MIQPIIAVPSDVELFKYGDHMKVILEDLGRAVPKEGKYINRDVNFIVIETERGKEAIPFSRIIRIEFSGGKE